MASEQTPLLGAGPNVAISEHEAVYLRFNKKKRTILTMVSWCGIFPLFVAGAFIPSIPQIAKDLHSTGPVISLAISLSVFASSVGALCGASYSTYYGRRPVYVYGLPLLCLGSLGVGSATSIPQLMVSQFIQAFGCSPAISVGGAVIGDIYRLEERGKAMGIFFAACLIGPALAPTAGGIAAHYASWRFMQYILAFAGATVYICMFFYFPETSHPGARGIDQRPLEADGSVPRFRFKFINPFASLSLLRSPMIVSVSFAGFLFLLTDYVLLVPLAYTIGGRYNITNEALIGLCFVPMGVGNMIGAPLSGWISDKVVVKWREQRGGVWYPEDRLRATIWGALVLVPLSVVCSGLAIKFVDGMPGLVFNLVCLFANGVGVDIVMSPSAAYVVDIMHSRSAEAMAVNNGLRNFLISIAIAGILPMIDLVGVTITNISAGILAWVGFGILWCTIRYGNQMRAWVDVEYSTAEGN